MRTTDFHHLLAAPPVSRTTFFTLLLPEASPRPPVEPLLDETALESSAELLLDAAASVQPSVPGFLA